ncbi:E3 ubiquitin-protein ligase PRT6 [Punica granatum]|uniref:E3 ubiquitin-protein ligase n=2 Tax=Punica granatum TaxID=22663 RepID=A0A6P8DGG5_PUNGR|nr:E3 ubiquitin-protein ligase PRT6 [Punica granatum]XP_031396413.1 E3 ubiquitin-protein ligase PRT6 [Punica granatum]
MDSMDIDSPPQTGSLTSPDDRIRAKLAQIGVPDEYLRSFQSVLVDFVRGNESWVPQLVSAILPSDEEVAELQQRSKAGSKKTAGALTVKERLRASMVWLQWLMFRSEPTNALNYLSEMNVGERGVCGAVWGNNDIAYRCRTCEQDPTCAICVPCFENGDHKDHDYSTIYTGGGCCDCGDITAWKREGFCSRHKGAEWIRPLPPEIAKSVQPVLDFLFSCWRDKLMLAESIRQERRKASNDSVEGTKFGNDLTFIVVEMLLEFCKHSESLVSFVSIRLFSCDGLLDILVRSERILNELVVKKLHELLLKLLAEPSFKYEFAKAFLSYYPTVVCEAVKECNDDAFKDYAAISTFSVQIFTVPTLTPRLVKEMNLLAMLFGCLGEIFASTAGEDGRLQVTKWQGLYDTTIRVVEDIRFVMSHAVVPKYILCNQQDILRTWMKLLAFVQGMNPQKRETGIPAEEEIENTHLPFGLCFSIASIHSLLVNGAYSDAHFEETSDFSLFNTCQKSSDDADSLRHAKVGRLSQESSACGVTGMSSPSGCGSKAPDDDSTTDLQLRVPAPVLWLIYECLRALENWLLADNTLGAPSASSRSTSLVSSSNFSAFKKLLRIRRGRHIFGRLSSSDDQQAQQSRPEDDDVSMALEDGKDSEREVKLMLRDEGHSFSGSTTSSDSSGAVGDDHAPESEALHVLSLSEWPNIIYDVSSQDISVHIPLHRLLSLLLQRALKQCYGESTISIPWHPSASSSNFFEHILGRCHPLGFSAFTMEHPLRIRVFVAEVHAGMWKKNGEAALLSCEWYRSVRWSEQGLELDLFMLQCCAALAPPDLYVKRILERFGLSNYLSLNPARASEYEPVLVQEMLTLIIQIVKERRFCGLTTSESLRRELVYKLAAGDATHSQLVKALPRDLSKFSRLQEVLDTVASYSNPSGYNQGMYSLRWPYWKELDLYHPRWNSRDLQVAEERYARFCSVSAVTAQLPRWTPIYAPLSRIAGVATCKMILQIIRAVLFYAVLNDKPSESRAPDTVLIPALHLFSLALDICFQLRESNKLLSYVGDSLPILAFATEEVADGLAYGFGELSLLSLLVMLKKLHKRDGESLADAGSCDLSSLVENLLKKCAELDSSCMTKLQQLAPELVNQLSQSALNIDMGSSGSASDGEKRKAKARQRQAAIMAKMRAEQSKFLASIDSSGEGLSSAEEVTQSVATNETQESARDVCSLCHDTTSKIPLSFLIHLQKSRLASLVDRGPLSWDRVQQPDKDHINIVNSKDSDQCGAASLASVPEAISHSQLDQLVQNAVRRFASYGHSGEVNAFIEFVKAEIPSIKNLHPPCISADRKEGSEYKFETLEQDMYLWIKKNLHSNPQLLGSVGAVNFTAAEGVVGEQTDAENILFGKYVAFLKRERAENPSASENARDEDVTEVSMENISAFDGFGPVDCDGIYLSSCGHAVHHGCLDRYLSSLKERYIRRIVFEGGHIVDLDQGEFLCPVCRRLANSVLPAVPSGSGVAWNQPPSLSLNLSQCPSAAGSDITCLHLPRALFLLQSVAEMVNKGEIFKAFSLQCNARLKLRLESFVGVLSKMYFPRKQEKLLGSARTSRSIIMWDTLRYSIISTEIAARTGRTSLAPNVSLNNLYKELTSSGKFILSLFLKIVQSTRTENALDVLQRFRGIKLFADSICSGISSDYPSNLDEQRGNLFWILKDAEKEISYVDTQFWRRAVEPVLAHDPFSSLMWVLFCLPFPFLFSEESFLSLVHIFYAVSVAQVIATYTWKSGFKLDESDLRDCLIADIYKIMAESRFPDKYFVSNHMDSSYSIRSAIQRFTFPYLRRCLLLWKLVNSSTPAPFSDMNRELDATFQAMDNMDESSDVLELRGVQELEKMFKIPSVDIVLKDQNIRHLVQRWFHHLFKEFELNRFKWVVHCTRASPFKLMELPHVYQDLLRRYIKQRCPDCNSVLEEPALCLLCGRLCSPTWKPCCRESGCQAHSTACGAGTGVFLMIRRTTILLQRSARQAPWPSPYLDAFGEEDIEMHRGKPLYLNEERYAALNYMVASHGFDRSSKVLRQTTLGAFLL